MFKSSYDWENLVFNLKELSIKEIVTHNDLLKVKENFNASPFDFDDDLNKPLLEAFNNWLIRIKDPKGVDVFLEIFAVFEKQKVVSQSIGDYLIRFLTGHHSYHIDPFYLQNDFNNVYYKICERFNSSISIDYLLSSQTHNNCEFFFKKFIELYKNDLSCIPITERIIQWIYFGKLIKYMHEFDQLTDYHIETLLSYPFLPQSVELKEVLASESVIKKCSSSFLKKESQKMSVDVKNLLVDYQGNDLSYGIKNLITSSKYVELRFFRNNNKINIFVLKIWTDAQLKDVIFLKDMDLEVFEKVFGQIAIEFNNVCDGNPRKFDHKNFSIFLTNIVKSHILVTKL